MSAFISDNIIYVYDDENEGFQGVNFDGKIVSGSFIDIGVDVGIATYVYIIDNDGQLWKLLHNPYRFQAINIQTQFSNVVCGAHISAAIDINGNIWISDDILHNQEFAKFTDNINFVSMASDSERFLAIDDVGNLWAYGSARYGEFGVQNNTFNQLTKVVENYGFTSVSTAEGATVCVDSQGNAWGCGNDLYYVLGWRSDEGWQFRKIAEGVVVKDAICGRNCLILLTQDGRVYTCGPVFSEEVVQPQNMPLAVNGPLPNIEYLPQLNLPWIGTYRQILENIIVDQMCYSDKIGSLMMKDIDGNIWIAGQYQEYIYPPRMIPGFTTTTLLNQRLNLFNQKRFRMTKRATRQELINF